MKSVRRSLAQGEVGAARDGGGEIVGENYLSGVRDQYEQHPYPPRDPELERTRLLEMLIDRLSTINHYCFRGEFDFECARVLVAGGGTGDSTIYLAEQLQRRNAEVVYLDISRASMAVAQRRADVRKIENITWKHQSVLDLSPESSSLFDYVSCTGVLHHLADPAEGLRRLKSVLKPSGGMGLMVYGKYGRTGVYQMQELMRLVNRNETDLAGKIANTRRMLNQLPSSNWFRHNESFLSDHKKLGEPGLVDLLLHEQDVAYGINDLHALLNGVGLRVVEFSDVKMRLSYNPELYVRDPVLLEKIAKLDKLTRQSIAELLIGLFMKHDVYVSCRPDAQAQLGSLSHVPFFFPPRQYAGMGPQIAEMINRQPGHPLRLRHETGFEFTVSSDPFLASIFAEIDGRRAWRDIFQNARQRGMDGSDQEMLERFRPTFEQFRQFDWMLLRDAKVREFPETVALQAETQRRMQMPRRP